MYLSRLRLNPRSVQVRRDVADHQQLHRTVLSAFPQLPASAAGQDARAHFGVLHRLETDSAGHIALLVQSQAAPNWSGLPNGYCLSAPETKPLAEKHDAIHVGQHLVFRVKANPTRKIDTKSGPDGKRRNGKRVDLRSDEERAAWLARKGEAGGFRILSVRTHAPIDVGAVQRGAVPDVRVRAESRQWGSGRTATQPAGGNGRRLTFASVTFDGVLEVTDADLFRQTLAQGIGSGKAYGFGLLSIAPLATTTIA